MKRKLTEYQAWTWLARLWDEPQVDGGGDCFVDVEGQDCYGLCSCIAYSGKISSGVFNIMGNRIHKLPEIDNGFCFSFDRDGAKARAAFCRKMAAKAKPKRKVKA